MSKNRNIYLKKKNPEIALQEWLDNFYDFEGEIETIAVEDARGRITACAIKAKRSAPHYYASAMDGIATRAELTFTADARNPVKLMQVEDFTWVDTGDPIPENFNTVIKVEELNIINDNELMIERSANPWQHIRMIGESVIKKNLVLPINHQIRAYDIGGLLEAGITEIEVRSKPTIGIIPTGTELVNADQEPARGQLIEFNSKIIKAFIKEWGGEATISEIIADDYQQIRNKFAEYNQKFDFTIILSGSSAGKEDFTIKILTELGEVFTHGVNLMPGKPLILGKASEKPVMGLPGYPIAAIFTFFIFGQPLIKQMQGRRKLDLDKVEALLKRKLPSTAGINELIRVNLAEIDDKLVAIPRKRGSAAMESLLNSDGVMVIPENEEGFAVGEMKDVYLLKPLQNIKKDLMLSGSHDFSLDFIKNEFAKNIQTGDFKFITSGSMGGLTSLRRKEVHLAGSHLIDAQTGAYNRHLVKRLFSNQKIALINLVEREQGLMINNNLDKIKSLTDLAKEKLVYINRQRGSGTRVLFDYLLAEHGISKNSIIGYEREVYTHLAAAATVTNGGADAAMGIRAAAEIMDLNFIPLKKETYQLILPEKFLNDSRITILLDIIKSATFKDYMTEYKGYSIEKSGLVEIIEC